MFGKNPVLKQDLSTSRELKVVKGSPFFTIQGEGPYIGHPAVFVRLHGCNLRCWFCDTEFSNPDDPVMHIVELARKVYDMKAIDGHKFNLVVITGGEPLRQNILPFCKLLLDQGFTVQIETAGSLWVEGLDELLGPRYGHRFAIICSPKTPTIHEKIYRHATAFKYVIGSETRVDENGMVLGNTQKEDGPIRPLAAPRVGAPVYLSPMDEYDDKRNESNRQRVASLCLTHGYIAGVQMHKLMQIQEP